MNKNLIIFFLVAFNILLSKYDNLQLIQLIFNLILIIILIFFSKKLRDDLLFFTIALIPTVLERASGYINFGPIYLAPYELFLVLYSFTTLCNFKDKINIKFKYEIFLLLSLFIISFISVLFSEDRILRASTLLRFSFITLFSILILIDYVTSLKILKNSILTWPFVALIGLTLNDLLPCILFLDMSFDKMRHIAQYLPFLFPIVFTFSKHFSYKITFFLIIYFLTLVAFSFSRSLLLVVVFQILFFIINGMMVSQKKSKIKIIISLCLVGMLFFISNDYLNFSIDSNLKGSSNMIRVLKIQNAFNTFLNNPFLGIGFGQIEIDHINSTKGGESHWQDTDFIENVTNVKASAEFGPSQIAAEIGVFGLIISFLMMYHLVSNTKKIINQLDLQIFSFILIITPQIVFFTEYIQTNILLILPIWFSIIILSLNLKVN